MLIGNVFAGETDSFINVALKLSGLESILYGESSSD